MHSPFCVARKVSEEFIVMEREIADGVCSKNVKTYQQTYEFFLTYRLLYLRSKRLCWVRACTVLGHIHTFYCTAFSWVWEQREKTGGVLRGVIRYNAHLPSTQQ